MLASAFQGRRVLVTGHTGFKGSWLCAWLAKLGARVTGVALDPNQDQRLFTEIGVHGRIVADHRVDVRQREAVAAIIDQKDPEFVFHLAAQPLVRLSYAEPAATFDVNVQGTVNVLDGIRRADRPCVVIVATTDKVYENNGDDEPYREGDRLGGHDPYSASKAGAELVIASYRRSFFANGDIVRVASARAGNVVGGGDWSRDRIVPDCIRALRRGEVIAVRNKTSTRPWQHVLEPLSGYLRLAAAMDRPEHFGRSQADVFCDAFNFGPRDSSHRTVADLVEELLVHSPGEWSDESDPAAPHEAGKLQLSIEKAAVLLHWRPVWDFRETIRRTVQWYRAHERGADMSRLTDEQIDDYQAAAESAVLPWAEAA